MANHAESAKAFGEFECPEQEDRTKLTRDWSCDQIENYNNLSINFTINNYIVNILQLMFFSYLFLELFIKTCREKGSLGRLPLLICSLIIANGIFALLRTSGSFKKYKALLVNSFLSEITYYLAVLLFGIKYYEVALLMEQLLKFEED